MGSHQEQIPSREVHLPSLTFQPHSNPEPLLAAQLMWQSQPIKVSSRSESSATRTLLSRLLKIQKNGMKLWPSLQINQCSLSAPMTTLSTFTTLLTGASKESWQHTLPSSLPSTGLKTALT